MATEASANAPSIKALTHVFQYAATAQGNFRQGLRPNFQKKSVNPNF
jgi:hypothetical protein